MCAAGRDFLLRSVFNEADPVTVLPSSDAAVMRSAYHSARPLLLHVTAGTWRPSADRLRERQHTQCQAVRQCGSEAVSELASNHDPRLFNHGLAGSTDSTKEWIAETMAGVPGQLLEEPFRDFEYNRNHVLTSHGARTMCGPSAIRAH